MTEWEKITEFQRNWVEQQQKMMTEWLDSLHSAGGDASMDQWRKTADLMEKQVNSALDGQKQSLLSVAENMEQVENAPDAFNQAIRQLEEGIEQWAEVQQRIWKVWFDTLRAASPAPRTPADVMMKNWEDMIERTRAIQEEWLLGLSGPGSKSGGKGGKASGKKSSKSG